MEAGLLPALLRIQIKSYEISQSQLSGRPLG